jgi:histone-lysine N-methyltransferase SETD8
MVRGRRKGRGLHTSDRQGSQDSNEGPREKETKLADYSHNNIMYLNRESGSERSRTQFGVLSSTSTNLEFISRPACHSPTMPMLSPEMPLEEEERGDAVLLQVRGDGPPVLSQYGEEDRSDQASERSEGDSGKENDEDISISWRGSRSSIASKASRSSRPRSGLFNQINSSNVLVSKPVLGDANKPVLGDANKPVLGDGNVPGPVTRSSQLFKPSSTQQHPEQGVESSPAPKLNLDMAVTRRAPESPIKGSPRPLLQSPMSPHKIQMPARPSLAQKLKHAISSPKTLSTKSKRQTLRKTDVGKSNRKQDKLVEAAEGSRQITDFFPIRRSERKSKSELEKEKMEGIEARLLATDDTCLDLEVQEIPLKGRGVVAARSYEKGEFVLEYAGELIDRGAAKDRESMYSLDTTKGCYMYYFTHRNKQYCIDATHETGRFGRLVNHSCKAPNCVPKVFSLNDEPRVILVARHDIEKDTELLYDYGDRSKESLASHPWLML